MGRCSIGHVLGWREVQLSDHSEIYSPCLSGYLRPNINIPSDERDIPIRIDGLEDFQATFAAQIHIGLYEERRQNSARSFCTLTPWNHTS